MILVNSNMCRQGLHISNPLNSCNHELNNSDSCVTNCMLYCLLLCQLAMQIMQFLLLWRNKMYGEIRYYHVFHTTHAQLPLEKADRNAIMIGSHLMD